MSLLNQGNDQEEPLIPELQTKPRGGYDFFNIRGYSTYTDHNRWRGKNLVNRRDPEMKELQTYLVNAHLYDILGIPLPSDGCGGDIHEYDRFGGGDPGFRRFPILENENILLPGYVFPNGSSANRYAIDQIKTMTGKKLLAGIHSHVSVKSQLGIEAVITDGSVLMDRIRQGTIGGIVATFGTTNFGSNDDRIMDTEVLNYCKDHGIHIHLDMAYGGYYLSEKQKERLSNNYDYIHSLMIDPHKMICDIGCSLLLFPSSMESSLLEVEYFAGLGTIAGTSLSPISAYQAQLFLQRYGGAGLKQLQCKCMNVARYIANAFENAGYTLYTPSSHLQYPNICVKVGGEKIADYIIEYFYRRAFQIAKIYDGDNYGIRIFVSPVADFFTQGVVDYFIDLLSEIPREQFIELEE